jgi:PAS domain S-box-containing protein
MRSRSWKQGLEMPSSALREKTYEEEYVQVLQALLEFAPGGIFSYSAEADEQFSFISKNMLQFLGYTREEFMQKFENRFSNMVYVQDRERVLREIREQIAEGEFDRCEYRIERKDGSLIWVHDEGHIVTDGNGKKWFYVVILDNSGDVRLQQKERDEFQKAMQDLLDANPNALCCFRLNLNTNRCISSFGTSQYIVRSLQHATADGLLSRLAEMASAEKKAETADIFNRQHLLEGFRSGVTDREVVYPRRDETGEDIWVRTSIHLLKNPETGEIEAVGYSNDVTRERLTNSIIRIITESEYDFIAVLHANTGMVEAVNLNSGLPSSYHRGFANEKSEQKFSDLRKNGAAVWVAEEDRSRYLQATELDVIRRELDQSGHYALTIHTNLPDGAGHCRWRSLQHYYIGDSRNEILIIDSDVTEKVLSHQKELEREASHNERMRDIMDSISGGISVLYMSDPDHLSFGYVNKQLYRMLGFEPAAGVRAELNSDTEALVREYFDNALTGIHPDDLERVKKTFHDNYNSQQFTVDNYRTLCADGSYVWLWERVNLREVTPEHRVFYAIYREVGDEVRMQNELKMRLEREENLRKEAMAANDAKTDFLSRMSHDIRTPLNGIIGLTYLTREIPDLPAAASANLSKIDISSKFLLSLVNDILDMSRAESGKIELHPEPYTVEEFNSYLDAVIRPLCAEKNQQFRLQENVTSNLIPLADKSRINQVLFNLLSNAVKYTPEGGMITYSISGHTIGENRVEIEHVITDTGIGMSSKFQEMMFDPFAQENRDDSSTHRGSGLGLAIVKKLVDLMGGTVEVQSAIGKGTSIRLHLQFDAVSRESLVQKHAGQSSRADLPALAGMHVLLCEDQILNQEIMRAILEKKKILVDIAEDGAEGISRFCHSQPGFYDAILMDVRMPVMDGYEATARIRRLDRSDAKSVPIIAMTADAFSDAVQKCMEVGMNAHIAKPVDPDLLFDTLQQILKKQETE